MTFNGNEWHWYRAKARESEWERKCESETEIKYPSNKTFIGSSKHFTFSHQDRLMCDREKTNKQMHHHKSDVFKVLCKINSTQMYNPQGGPWPLLYRICQRSNLENLVFVVHKPLCGYFLSKKEKKISNHQAVCSTYFHFGILYINMCT